MLRSQQPSKCAQIWRFLGFNKTYRIERVGTPKATCRQQQKVHGVLTGTMLRYAAARFAYSFSSKPAETQISSESAYSAILSASVYISIDFVHSPSLNTSFPSPNKFHTSSFMNTWKQQRKIKNENQTGKVQLCLDGLATHFILLTTRSVKIKMKGEVPTFRLIKPYLILVLTSRKRKGWSKKKIINYLT